MFANSYFRYVARFRGQQVVLLKEGFEAYMQEAKPEHSELVII